MAVAAVCVIVGAGAGAARAADGAVLVEAESFEKPGGWVLDTQFITSMGSPYLLAHGIGRPVADASTTVQLPGAGTYRVFVRTKDWVAHWDGTSGSPGKFQVLINGNALSETFGTKGAEWNWQDGGTVAIDGDAKITLSLHDLTGFDGRCDAIYFTKDVNGTPPPSEGKILPAWRRKLLGLGDEPTLKDGYDLVVVGGGYSGMGAAISAARQGIKVALIQDRPVLGGNGSSEVRVWAMGNIRRGPYPTIGEIVAEFSDHAHKSPGTYEEFEDAKKEAIVRAEPNIDLFLNHHAYKVDMDDKKIGAVYAFDTRTSEQKKFVGRFFVDCTGHGTIGALANADYDMTDKGRMGMSNMWAWDESDKPAEFPDVSGWALPLKMKDFPYPRDHHGQWFWESGFDQDPINGAEYIRDWNLRAVYGAFNAMKNGDGADKHDTAFLTWVAFVGGPRESRRLLGDVILSEDDIVSKKEFKDGTAPSTWSIDLHYPKQQYAEKFPDNPFISIAKMNHAVDRNYGYPIPYRCFYSRNVPNLFMAGRCISVTHEALGTVRVMKTCGMMGEVVGKAAAIATAHSCTPRDVYEQYWDEMTVLLKQPGAMRRDTLAGDFYLRDDAVKLDPPKVIAPSGGGGHAKGLDPKKLPGIVIDDDQAKLTGKWGQGPGSLTTFVGSRYLYSTSDDATATFEIKPPKAGRYEVRICYAEHEKRGKTTPVTVTSADGEKTVVIDMTKKAPLEHGFMSLGVFTFDPAKPGSVTIAAKGANGAAHADAIQLLPVE
ncbi:MAG: FAD-dependent oxidoreductase [Phycisphaera sp.]|nr:FAD-dependent oxidoreductase [Phycisphaera sp.]